MTPRSPHYLVVAFFLFSGAATIGCSEDAASDSASDSVDSVPPTDGNTSTPDMRSPDDASVPTDGNEPTDADTRPPAMAVECILPPAAPHHPELPRLTVDTTMPAVTGRTIEVSAGDDLQAALDEAVPGDEVVLEAGAVFRGSWSLPAKSGDGWTIIRSANLDQLPPEGQRVSPRDAEHLAILETGRGRALTIEPGSQRYRIMGLEIRAGDGVEVTSVVDVGTTAASSVEEQPKDIVIDRCWIHGAPTENARQGITLNSRDTAIMGSYIDDIKADGQDSQAINSIHGAGPFRIVNNFLEGAAENIMFGGGTPSLEGVIPSDIEICGNYFFKRPEWRDDRWSVKNLFEIKAAKRVLLSANVLEGSWTNGQIGWAIILKTGDSSPVDSEDITITHNVIRDINHGVRASPDVSRILVFGNLLYDINADGFAFGNNDGTNDFVIDHNTVANGEELRAVIYFSGSGSGKVAERFQFLNNVVGDSRYGFHDFQVAEMPRIEGNVIVGPDPEELPPRNEFPGTLADVGFVDFASGDYRLASDSAYVSAGVEGARPGADVALLQEVLARVARR